MSKLSFYASISRCGLEPLPDSSYLRDDIGVYSDQLVVHFLFQTD